MSIISIIKKLYPFEYSIVGKGNNEAIKVFKKYFPFKIYSFKSDTTLNGWKVPRAFKVIKADLIKDKKIIYDGKLNPFAVLHLHHALLWYTTFMDIAFIIFNFYLLQITE